MLSSRTPELDKEKKKNTDLWLLYGWGLLPNSVISHWVLRGHMTTNTNVVSRQKFTSGQHWLIKR